MLSNPPVMSGLHSRQRQHRRQNSTPSAFEAVKIAPLPNLQQRQQGSHRRGLSLDIRRQHQQPATTTPNPRQGYTAVSITTTNPRSATTPQHVLQAAQQQRTARPGPSMPIFTEQSDSDSFLLSPQVSLHTRRFAGGAPATDIHGLSMDSYSGSLAMFDRTTDLNGVVQPSPSLEFFASNSTLSTPTFLDFPDVSPHGSAQGWLSEEETTSTQSRRTSRRISNGIVDKVAKFEALESSSDIPLQRPRTPGSQTDLGTFCMPLCLMDKYIDD